MLVDQGNDGMGYPRYGLTGNNYFGVSPRHCTVPSVFICPCKLPVVRLSWRLRQLRGYAIASRFQWSWLAMVTCSDLVLWRFDMVYVNAGWS